MLFKTGFLLPALVLASVSAAVAMDQEQEEPFPLMVGDAAPALPATEWLRGSPVQEFEKGRIYVLDLWSTWCTPCIKAFPHLSELQATYADAVTIIGANVWEMRPQTVPGFVEAQGENITFSICMDVVPEGKEANQGLISEQWLYGSGSEALPVIFIIDHESRVAWIGHSDIDEPLSRIVAGTWDLKAEADSYRVQKMEEANAIRMRWRIDEAITREDWPAAVKDIDALLAFDPKKHAESAGNSFAVIAGMIANSDGDDPDLDIALSCAKGAIELAEDKTAHLYRTLARIHFLRGEMNAAVETQTQALEAASEANKAEFQEVLEEYLARGEYKSSTPPSGESPDGNEFYAFDTPPEVVETFAPEYPEGSKAVGATGMVQIEVTIDVQGDVVAARVIKSTGNKSLDAEALRAAEKWRFKPAKNKNIPVKSKIVIPFEFKLAR